MSALGGVDKALATTEMPERYEVATAAGTDMTCCRSATKPRYAGTGGGGEGELQDALAGALWNSPLFQ